MAAAVIIAGSAFYLYSKKGDDGVSLSASQTFSADEAEAESQNAETASVSEQDAEQPAEEIAAEELLPEPIPEEGEGGSLETVPPVAVVRSSDSTAVLPAETGEAAIVRTFPYTSERDQLTLESLDSYSGIYIEDGSDSEAGEVAVLRVTNTSDQAIEHSEIKITAGGTPLTFAVSLLPAHSTAMVMEANKTASSEFSEFTYQGASTAWLSGLDLCSDRVLISTDAEGNVTVQNISGEEIGELRIFYKNQADSGEYIGGIAYNGRIQNLKAGESVTGSLPHFDGEYGKVLMVRIY